MNDSNPKKNKVPRVLAAVCAAAAFCGVLAGCASTPPNNGPQEPGQSVSPSSADNNAGSSVDAMDNTDNTSGTSASMPEESAPSAQNVSNSISSVEIPDSKTPKAGRAAVSGVLVPTAAGKTVYKNAKATIDASNVSQGYVMVKYNGGTNKKIKAQVTKQGGTTYTYTLSKNGQYDVLPFTEGDGTYQVRVFENVSGTQYTQALSQSINVKLANQNLPFLYPNQYVNFTANNNAVAKAKVLAQGAESDLDVVARVYNYVISNVKYDVQKAETVQSDYLPVVDDTLATNKGICFDYAALMTSMLRSQGVPTKLLIGYSGTTYHAWVSTYITNVGWVNGMIEFDGQNWKLMDPTFAASAHSSDSIMQYIGDNKNYQEKFAY